MKFILYELEEYSGEKTKVYSPMIYGESKTLFEKFFEENKTLFEKELTNISDRYEMIGKEVGLFEESFDSNEYRDEQLVCKLKDYPKGKLRSFFIECGNHEKTPIIILGNGGMKSPLDRATQDDVFLDSCVWDLAIISKVIKEAKKEGHLIISDNGFIGSTTNYIYDSDNYAATK